MKTARESLIEAKKFAAAMGRKAETAQQLAQDAALAREKAEAALRNLDRQLKAARDRADRAEAKLKSLSRSDDAV